jgi:hypothetical protein
MLNSNVIHQDVLTIPHILHQLSETFVPWKKEQVEHFGTHKGNVCQYQIEFSSELVCTVDTCPGTWTNNTSKITRAAQINMKSSLKIYWFHKDIVI